MERPKANGRLQGEPSARDVAKAQTRARLLDAAARRFIADGFMESSTASIAADAGVAHGTLFLHFPDREALLIAVVERLLSELGSALHDSCFGATDLEQLCRHFLESLSRNEAIYGALVRDLPRFPLPLKRTVFATFTAITCHFTDVIVRGQAQGTLKPIPAATANSFFFGALNHLFLYRDLMTSDGRVVATHGDALTRSFVAMMAQPDGNHVPPSTSTEEVEKDTK